MSDNRGTGGGGKRRRRSKGRSQQHTQAAAGASGIDIVDERSDTGTQSDSRAMISNTKVKLCYAAESSTKATTETKKTPMVVSTPTSSTSPPGRNENSPITPPILSGNPTSNQQRQNPPSAIGK